MRVTPVLLLVTVLVAGACGDDDGDGTGASAPDGTWSVGGDGERWPGDDDNQQLVAVDPEAANLTLIKDELKAYHDDGRYQEDLTAMAALAEECMLDEVDGATRPALVLDIDETSLSNYDWMVEVDFLRASPLLRDLFTEHASGSDIPPIDPVHDLYEVARANDIAVFFITGRGERLREVTEANLANAGYDDYAEAFFAPDDYAEPSIVPFKSGTRESIEEQGYTIVANVGDQDSDLEGGHGACPHKLADPFYFIP